MLPSSDEILANFALLDDGYEQFEYLMELGKALPDFPDALRTADRLVPGCQSKVWLDMASDGNGPDATMTIAADSDAHITKGLVALLVALFSGRSARDVLGTDAVAIVRDLGLGQQITSKRANGLRSMIERIKGYAGQVVSAPA